MQSYKLFLFINLYVLCNNLMYMLFVFFKFNVQLQSNNQLFLLFILLHHMLCML